MCEETSSTADKDTTQKWTKDMLDACQKKNWTMQTKATSAHGTIQSTSLQHNTIQNKLKKHNKLITGLKLESSWWLNAGIHCWTLALYKCHMPPVDINFLAWSLWSQRRTENWLQQTKRTKKVYSTTHQYKKTNTGWWHTTPSTMSVFVRFSNNSEEKEDR